MKTILSLIFIIVLTGLLIPYVVEYGKTKKWPTLSARNRILVGIDLAAILILLFFMTT